MLIQVLKNDISTIDTYLGVEQSHTNDVLLMQNGVYAINQLVSIYPNLTIYVIDADLQASGMIVSSAAEVQLQRITHEKWVELTIKHKTVVTVQ